MSSIDPRRVRVGVLSTARIGQRVIPALQQARNVEVVAVAGRDLARTQAFAERIKIPRALAGYDELLADPDVDAVYNPLPNSLHRPWTIRAAERGKHVLCEKPLALNVSECDDMVAACEANQVRLMEAFMYRFHPQIQKALDLIADGAIGRVHLVRSTFSFLIGDEYNIRLDKALGGGALYDVGCYCVNVSRLVVGAEPAEVQAMAEFGLESGVDETLIGLMRFPGGEMAVFDCGFRHPMRQALEIVGTGGVIDVPAPFLPGGRDVTIRLRRDNQTEDITISGATHYSLMAEHFAESILTGASLRWPPADARANMTAIGALYLAARTGRHVKVE